MLIGNILLQVVLFWVLGKYLNLRERHKILKEDLEATKYVVEYLEDEWTSLIAELPSSLREEVIKKIYVLVICNDEHPINSEEKKIKEQMENFSNALIDNDAERHREEARTRNRRNKPPNKKMILICDSQIKVLKTVSPAFSRKYGN